MTQWLESARKALDVRAYYLLCAEVEHSVRKLIPDWKPALEKPEDQRVYAQACLNALSIRAHRQQALDYLKDFANRSADRPADVAWATRNIAMLNATGGTPQQRRAAIADLRKTGDELGSIEEMRSRVNGLAVASRQMAGLERRAALNEAIGLLKQIVESKEANPRDTYHLGQFYRLAGQRDKYRECLEVLMQRDPANLYYVVVYVDDLLDNGELAKAGEYKDRLVKAAHDPRRGFDPGAFLLSK